MPDGATNEHDVAAALATVQELLHTLERERHYPAAAGLSLHERLGKRLILLNLVDVVCRQAYRHGDAGAMSAVHRLLARLYDERFLLPTDANSAPSAEAAEIMHLIESHMLAAEDAEIDAAVLQAAPRGGRDHVRWLRDLIEAHRASKHSFYEHYLPQQATRSDVAYFLAQETTLDPRFDDVLALLQIGTTDRIKLAFARNYWDEVGNGDVAGFHSDLFQRALDVAGVTADYVRANIATESIVCGNLSMALALHRNYFAQAIGYFGVTEFLVPRRFPKFIAAWERLGFDRAGVEYHRLHSELDAEHGDEWFDRVIGPHIERRPDDAPQVVRGALYRLNSARRYLDALQAHCQQSAAAQRSAAE